MPHHTGTVLLSEQSPAVMHCSGAHLINSIHIAQRGLGSASGHASAGGSCSLQNNWHHRGKAVGTSVPRWKLQPTAAVRARSAHGTEQPHILRWQARHTLEQHRHPG